MDYHAELALIKQNVEKLLELHDPISSESWNPTDFQRLAFVHFSERVLDAIRRVRSLEKRKLLKEGQAQEFVPSSILVFIHDQVEPRVNALRKLLDHIDPEGADIRQIIDEYYQATGLQNVNETFENGIEQVQALIDRNPDMDFSWLYPDEAREVMDSPLISFDPNSWLDRASDLSPIRTHKKDVLLPSHIRLRIEELHRAYVFGCWLSVLALARAILEYSILDNIHKFGIPLTWPPLGRNLKGKSKKLSELIEELEPHIPSLIMGMGKLRDYGNDYLHPKKSQTSKESLFQSKSAAKDAMKTVVEVVEGLYLAR